MYVCMYVCMYTHRCDSKIHTYIYICIYVLVGWKNGYVIMEHTSAAGYVIQHIFKLKEWTENVDNHAVQLRKKSGLGRSLP